MDEDKVAQNLGDGGAASSPGSRPEAGQNRPGRNGNYPPTEFRFQKGRSGNPSGKTKRITQAMNDMLDVVMPQCLRAKLEDVIGQTLPKDMTFLEAHVFSELLASHGIDTGLRLEVSKDIRATAQGLDTQFIEVAQQQTDGAEGSLADRIYAQMIESAYKRGKLYNMPMPELERLAEERGFQLEAGTDGTRKAVGAETLSLTEGQEK